MTDFPFEKINDQDILLANAKKAVAMCKSLKPNSSPGYGMRFFVPPDIDFRQIADREIQNLILTSTYKLAAYLIYCRLHLSDDCYKNDIDFYLGHCHVLHACTIRNFKGCGKKNALNGLVDTMEILIEAPLKPFHYHYCDDFWFYSCVEISLSTLREIAKGTADFPFGKDEKLITRAKKLLDTWNKSSSEIE